VVVRSIRCRRLCVSGFQGGTCTTWPWPPTPSRKLRTRSRTCCRGGRDER